MSTLRKLLDDMPNLTDHGFGIWDGHGEDVDRKAIFERGRELLLGSQEDFDATCRWIRENLQPRKTINSKRTSYGLKHIAEREIGYITNGVFIAAMVHCGYRWKRVGPNAHFNVSGKAVRQAERRTRRKDN